MEAYLHSFLSSALEINLTDVPFQPQRKDPERNDLKAEWASEPVWAFWENRKISYPCRESNPRSSSQKRSRSTYYAIPAPQRCQCVLEAACRILPYIYDDAPRLSGTHGMSTTTVKDHSIPLNVESRAEV